jgi:hypothetical protein
MGSKVIYLNEYRQKKKKIFRERHKSRVENFIAAFIGQNFKVNFYDLNQQYLAYKSYENEMAWDYCDFREELKDAIKQVFGQQLWNEINSLYWFDPQWISQDELFELCTSSFILGSRKQQNAY